MVKTFFFPSIKKWKNRGKNRVSVQKCCGLWCRAVYITRGLFCRTQNPWLINESGFKSRAGYNGASTVFKFTNMYKQKEFNITPLKLSSCSHNSNKTLFWHFLFPGHKQGQVYFFQDILHTYQCTLKIPTLVWFIEKNKKNVGNIKEQQSGGTVCYVPLMLCK